MPDAALPVPFEETAPPAIASTFTREFRDPQGRAYSGTVTARRLSPEPFLSAETDVVDGRLTLVLEPGRYVIGAMLKDPDGVRAYTSEEVTIGEPSA
jgi:hypothetical protein